MVIALFISLAGLLALLTLGTALRPLWRPSRNSVLAAMVLLSLATLALYRLVGTPAALHAVAQTRAEPHTLDEAIAQLRDALRRNPDQVEGWLLLGRSLASQHQVTEARDAFSHALELAPDQPDVLVAAAQSRMLAAPGQPADATAVAQLERALVLQPTHQRARWFLGVAQRQAGQPAQAARTWQPLLSEVDAGTRASLLEQINLARHDAGQAPLNATAPTAATLTVKVALDPRLMARVSRTASVFVIARTPTASPMPVAVKKLSVQALPLTVTLDDGDNPMPTRTLSSSSEIELIARLSTNGDALPQDGGLESAPVRVKLPASTPVKLLIRPHTGADSL